MSSIYGEHIKLSIFGQSHGPAVGMVLDGIPAGLPVDLDALHCFLQRRAPGSQLTTSRQEADMPEFLGGIHNGFTCGAPIAATIANQNVNSLDYKTISHVYRPGHADYTAQIKYKGHQDPRGGGHFSGRLTAPMCVAGGLCKQWLERRGIQVTSKLLSVGTCTEPEKFPEVIQSVKNQGNSIGGVIQCVIHGLPAGLGDPMFGGMESRIAAIIFGIPGIKGIEFGSGFSGSSIFGSDNNDCYQLISDKVETKSNHCGGILGGITNGMPLQFQVAVKPTPSIAAPQNTLDFFKMEETELSITGRHDPCIALRAVPVVEAAAAIALFDALLCQRGENL